MFSNDRSLVLFSGWRMQGDTAFAGWLQPQQRKKSPRAVLDLHSVLRFEAWRLWLWLGFGLASATLSGSSSANVKYLQRLGLQPAPSNSSLLFSQSHFLLSGSEMKKRWSFLYWFFFLSVVHYLQSVFCPSCWSPFPPELHTGRMLCGENVLRRGG